MVSVLAFSVVTMLFNTTLIKLAGSDGLASLSIIWYTQGLSGALFRGFISGISPVISYNYGKKDKARQHKHCSRSALKQLAALRLLSLHWATLQAVRLSPPLPKTPRTSPH
ncbi:MAG: MATE family efflux transporter [Treponema sp.]